MGFSAPVGFRVFAKKTEDIHTKTLRSGKLDRYLDALEQVGDYSSSEPRDVYAFYILSGMTDRAKKFRERATKAASYDLDYFFKLVDQNPTHYIRK